MFCKTIAVDDYKGLALPANSRWLLSVLASVMLVVFNTAALAGSATVTWTPVSDTRVTGYEIGYGTASAQYQWIKVANANGKATASQVIDGLNAGTTYYFAVRSVAAASGAVSTYSTEASKTIPWTGDTTAPTVSISAPLTGTTYTSAQTVVVRATASDNVGVTKVELYDGTALKATLTSGYSYNWAITSGSNGTHSWTAKAYDAAGNTRTSAAVSVSVNIQTPVVGCAGATLWPKTATPKTLMDPDSAAVELGVKFRTDRDGYVCGIRFYKGGSRNSGTHLGRLWKSDGTLLAQATFSAESASGWQQVNFANPVPVTSGVVYVASYYAPNGAYSVDVDYFTNAGVDVAPLHALKTGVSGGNGLYLYGRGGLPANSWRNANYWVDVVFTWADTVFTTTQSSGSTVVMGLSEAQTGVVPSKAVSAVAGLLEAGEVTAGEEWTRVELTQTFADPVVIANAQSSTDLDPAVVRVEGVDPSGFWIRVHEWGYLQDDRHAPEQVSYLVVERGHHQLPDGARIEAGSLESSQASAFASVRFAEAFARAPVVLSSVASANDEEAVLTRVRKIGRRGFQVGLKEQEANAQTHSVERIDYVAWEASEGELDGLQYAAGLLEGSVTDAPSTLVFPVVLDRPPVFLAGLQATHDGDTASLRRGSLAADAVDLWAEEEPSQDDETRQEERKVGYVLIGSTGSIRSDRVGASQ